MASHEGWATKAARQIISDGVVRMDDRSTLSQEQRIAFIIAAHAEPLVALLRESRREHDDDGFYGGCPKSFSDNQRTCTCGADEWNARIDEVLK